jgi:hypothetical protein
VIEAEIQIVKVSKIWVKCGKLRDIQSFLFCHNKSELAVEVVNNLSNCESQGVQTKIKNL